MDPHRIETDDINCKHQCFFRTSGTEFSQESQRENYVTDKSESEVSVAHDHEEKALNLLATTAIAACANVQGKRLLLNNQDNGPWLSMLLPAIDCENTETTNGSKVVDSKVTEIDEVVRKTDFAKRTRSISNSKKLRERSSSGILTRRKRLKTATTQEVYTELGLSFAPKGISRTQTGKWRLQMKIGGMKKIYSRNLASLEEALWYYELKVLISDEPKYINEMITLGNFDALVRLRYCSSVDDYANKLMWKLEEYTASRDKNKGPDFSLEDFRTAERALNVMQVNATILEVEQTMSQKSGL